jgi:predicted TPR repeat methyltransferase
MSHSERFEPIKTEGTAVTGPSVLFLSSGDLLADRRYHWAIDHLVLGDLAGASEILLQAVEMAPGFATAWFALGAIRDKQGDHDGAVNAFGRARDSDPEDYHGARLQLARLGVGEATPAMTATYVRRLFDQHAPRFEDSLLNRLAYSGPQKLLDAAIVAGGRLRVDSMLDLGCGTGLAGVAFRPHVDRLTGVDVSGGMINQAAAKGVYDRLVVSELVQLLTQEADMLAKYHLIVAADVFVYSSDLIPIANAAARVLAPKGLFAFTAETHPGDGVLLQQTLRYAHGDNHVRTALAGANLQPIFFERVSARTEQGKPVPGLVAIATPNSSGRAVTFPRCFRFRRSDGNSNDRVRSFRHQQ